MEKNTYQILSVTDGVYEVPIFLESSVDEMGVLVGFDGEVEQIEQICNFSYTQTGTTVVLNNTVDISKVSQIYEVIYDVDWGDGTTDTISVHTGSTLNSIMKTYSTNGTYNVTISMDTPWLSQRVTKEIQVPEDLTVNNPLGTFSGFTIPFSSIIQSQDYINDLDYTNTTGDTTFSFAAMGRSRISEKKLYGKDTYTGVTIGTLDGVQYSGYTIDDLYYCDYDDGITMITGSTSDYYREEVFNQMLTRNEHFIGFIDEPTIYSDIFVERGKQGVLEKTFRLSEIDNMGELEIYGNGFFTIRKQ